MIAPPFEPQGITLLTLTAAALVLVLVGMGLMSKPRREIRAAGGPGMLAFELAGTDRAVRAILDRWGEEGQQAARRQLVADFVFIAGYTAALVALAGGSVDTVAQRSWLGFADAGALLAWGALVAGVLDVIENACLLRILAGASERAVNIAAAWVARVAAVAKFFLLGVVIAWLLLWVLPLVVTPWHGGRTA